MSPKKVDTKRPAEATKPIIWFYWHESAEGYQNLSRLVSYGYLEGFYYRPRVDRDLLSQYSKGLIALSACLKGGVQQKLLMEQHDSAMEEASSWRDIFGPGNFYLELQDHGLPAQQRINPLLLEISKKTGIPYVCTNDSHYLRQDDSVAHDVLLCIGTGKTVQDENRMRYASDQYYFKSPQEMAKLWGHLPEATLNTIRIAERCDIQIQTSQPLAPFRRAGRIHRRFLL